MDRKYEEDRSGIESNTVGVYRTAATVKGGRRFSFSAMVVCGDRQGKVGLGYGKANQVPNAIEKAQKKAKRAMQPFPLTGTTIPHEVTGRFGACSVRLVPASPGTGVIAGAAVRSVLDLVGVQDCLSKAYGSTNNKNLSKLRWTLDTNKDYAGLKKMFSINNIKPNNSWYEIYRKLKN